MAPAVVADEEEYLLLEGSEESGPARITRDCRCADNAIILGESIPCPVHEQDVTQDVGQRATPLSPTNPSKGVYPDVKYTGFAFFTLPNGTSFTGYMSCGLRNGGGLCVTPQGEVLHAQWADDKPASYVTLFPEASREAVLRKFRDQKMSTKTFSGAHAATGRWSNGLKHGYGSLCLSPTSQFIGQWKSGSKDGLGRFIREDGSAIVCRWVGHLGQGVGVMIEAHGKRHIVSFVDGSVIGFGRQLFPAHVDSSYVGQLHDGKRHGFGLLTVRGQSYIGEFMNQHPHGFGTYRWDDGPSVTGMWCDGQVKGFKVLAILQDIIIYGNLETTKHRVYGLPDGSLSLQISPQCNSGESIPFCSQWFEYYRSK